MGRKNSFLERQREAENLIFNAGLRCGMQFNNDMYQLALNCPDVMGKDVFGEGRMEKLQIAVQSLSDYYEPALDSRHPECDVYRDRIDKGLFKIWKHRLIPFEQRLDELKAVRYGKKGGKK